MLPSPSAAAATAAAAPGSLVAAELLTAHFAREKTQGVGGAGGRKAGGGGGLGGGAGSGAAGAGLGVLDSREELAFALVLKDNRAPHLLDCLLYMDAGRLKVRVRVCVLCVCVRAQRVRTYAYVQSLRRQ